MTHPNYRSLGRSGLIVSQLSLGTMTFGTSRWGTDETTSKQLFDAYLEEGGNFVDTADVYASGRSEQMLGKFIADRQLRHQIVLATKAGFSAGGTVQNGGNSAKHLLSALDASLKRLNTDFVDLYWVHVWDSITPAEELLETMTGMVRSGKIRYWGISNSPAWYVSKLATLAMVRGVAGPIAVQHFYSLANRDIEDEHFPMAAEFGIGIMPWSPLAYGLLSGKYKRSEVESAAPRAGGLPRDVKAAGETRPENDKRLDGANPFGDSLFTEKNWQILEVLTNIAVQIERTPAEVALSWVVNRPNVASTLIGVSRVDQLLGNSKALDLKLSSTHTHALNAISAPNHKMLYSLFSPTMRQHAVFNGHSVGSKFD